MHLVDKNTAAGMMVPMEALLTIKEIKSWSVNTNQSVGTVENW